MEIDFARYPTLKGRTVLVTGGATGIGACIVEEFVAQNSKVAFVDVNVSAANQLVDRLEQTYNNRPWFGHVDLRDITALKEQVEKIQTALGPIRVLVNNAASDDRHKLDDVTSEYWDERIAVNLKHQFFATQAVKVQMADAGGGSIINMGSIAWMFGMQDATVYNVSKAAVLGLTKSLARELGNLNIRVNCIVPGAVITDRQMEKWLTPDSISQILDHQCLKENLYPSDVARFILFLAADDSRLVTNQEFIIDAGWI